MAWVVFLFGKVKAWVRRVMYGALLYIRFLILLLISAENCSLHLGKLKFTFKRLLLCLQIWFIGICIIALKKKGILSLSTQALYTANFINFV